MTAKVRSPFQYKTAYGLYNASCKAIEILTTTDRAWWTKQAIEHCDRKFPEMSEQIRSLFYRPATLEDLARNNEINN